MRMKLKKFIAALVNVSMLMGTMYYPVNASDREFDDVKQDNVSENTGEDPAGALSVPVNLHWKDDALLTAAWDAVEGADYYDIVVRVYEGETLIGEQAAGTSNCEADLQQEVRAIAPEDAYIVSVDFKVQAKNTESEQVSGYSHYSDKKDYSINAMDTIDPPEEVVLSIVEDVVLVAFTPVENADHYIVSSYFVKDNIGIGGSVETNDGKHDITMQDGYCVVDISEDFRNSYKSYIGETVHLVANVKAVTALGGVSEASPDSNGVDYKKDSSLTTPEIVSVNNTGDGRVICVFNDETQADDYEIEIVFKNFVSGEGGTERDPDEKTTALMVMLKDLCGSPAKNGMGGYELDIYPALRYWLHFLDAIDPTALTDAQIRIRSVKDGVYSNFSNMVEIRDLITEPYYIAPTDVVLTEGENNSYSISFNKAGDAPYYRVVYYIYSGNGRASDSKEIAADQIEWNEDRGTIDLSEDVIKLYNDVAGDRILYADAVVRGKSEGAIEYGLRSSYSNRVRVYPFKPLVKEMSLFPQAPILAIGKSLYLGKTVDPADGYYETISWTSGDEGIAAVDDLGKISAVAEGCTTVTAVVDNTVRTGVSVNVYKMNSNIGASDGGDSVIGEAGDIIDDIANETDPDVSDTDIDPKDVEEIKEEIREAIENGDTFHTDMKYIQQYFDEYKKNWGQIQKAAKDLNAQFEGAYSIEVEMYHKDKDDNDHHIGNITELDDEVTFTFDLPTGSKEEGSGETKKYVLVRIHINKNGETEYSPIECTVNEDGTVTAKSDQFSDFVILSVDIGTSDVVAVSGISVSPDSVALTVGETKALTATVTPDNATDKSVSWNSAEPSVATVDESGVVTAVAAGTATITVTTTDGGYTASCEVTVKEASISDNIISVNGVTLSDTTFELKAGETKILTATVTPDDATDKSISWNSSEPSVATVSSNGLVNAIAAGTATITVTTAEGGFTASCVVTVSEVRTGIYAELVDGDIYMYTGSKITPAVAVYKGEEKLVEGVDYKLSYKDNLKAGTAEVTITGKILAFEMTRDFTIEPVDISDNELVKGSDVIKLNKGGRAMPVLYYGSYKLTAKDYTVQGESKFTKDGELKIEGTGNFTGTRTFDVAIGKAEKIKVKMTGKPSFIYDGGEHKLTEGVDYEVDGTYDIVYSNDVINAGTVKVTFIGTGDYSGTISKTYKIMPDKTAAVTVSLEKDTIEYDALGAYPAVSVKKADGTGLIAGKDYNIKYSGNKAVTDKAKVNIKFIGNYKGVKDQSKTFKITAAALDETNASVYCADMAYSKAAKYLSVPYINVENVALTKKDYTAAYFIGERDITKAKITDNDFGNADTINVTVKITLGGKKNSGYSGTLTGSYTITKTDADHDLSKATVRLMRDGKALKSIEYTGKPMELGDDVEVIVTIGKNKTVVGASEYELHYSNNINKGKATVIVAAKEGSSYHGSKATSVKIVKGSLPL